MRYAAITAHNTRFVILHRVKTIQPHDGAAAILRYTDVFSVFFFFLYSAMIFS